MKKILLVLAVGCMLAGCHSKLDLGNVDTSAEMKMGLTLPVGKVHITLMDLLGDINNLAIDTIDGEEAMTWKLDTAISRYFHQIDLAQYISSAIIDLNVYEKIAEDYSQYMYGGRLITPPGVDIPVSLDFPLAIQLDGINKKDNLNSERLDSAFIEDASFASTIQAVGGLPLEWGWVDTVTLNLGEQVSRKDGHVMKVYDPKDPKYAQFDTYGKKIPTDIDNFTLIMMKDRTKEASNDNVLDECTFIVHFHFVIPGGTDVELPTTAGFKYKLDVQFINYRAIWGMFDPSEEMADSSVIDLSNSWDGVTFLTKSKLPLAKPSIKTKITTEIGGALELAKTQVFVLDDLDKPTYAHFGADEREDTTIAFTAAQYVNPWTDPIGTKTKDMEFTLDRNHGRIHRLFNDLPQKLGYRFDVAFDTTQMKQIRITNNTDIRIDVNCKLPMIFDSSVYIMYPDTMDNLNISQLSIDSIQAENQSIDTIKKADIKVVMKAESLIPLDLKLSMRCYDANGDMVMDPHDSSKPFILLDTDTIKIESPGYVPNSGKWVKSKTPKESYFISTMDKERLNTMPKIEKIVYTAVLDDESFKNLYQQGFIGATLDTETDVNITIGLSADVEAVLNFDKNK